MWEGREWLAEMTVVFDTVVRENLCGGDIYVKTGIKGENEQLWWSEKTVFKANGTRRAKVVR